MALWSRARQLRLRFRPIPKEFNRCYTLNHGPLITDQHCCSGTLISGLSKSNQVPWSTQLEIFNKVRFFAAPVQFTQKKEEKDTDGPTLNEQITTPFLRLVTDEGHCVVSRNEALARAKSLKMDLVMVDRVAKPPVCRIFNYNKEKYNKQQKEKERAKSKSKLKAGAFKEIRFAAKINQKDLEMKANMAKRLMESGYRVKCTAIEPTNNMDLQTLISRFSALIEDVAIVESEQMVEKKQAFVVIRHAKFGPAKKGPGKKASQAVLSSQSSESQLSEEEEDRRVDSQESLDEDIETNKSKWSYSRGDDDIESVFDINDEQSPLGPPPPSVDRNPRNVAEPAQNRYARDPRAGNTSRDMTGRGARPPQRLEDPTYDASKKGSSHSSDPNSPTKSYGIFSGQKVDTVPGEQNGPAENNRYKKRDPPDSARSAGVPPYRSPPINRGPGAENPRQGRW